MNKKQWSIEDVKRLKESYAQHRDAGTLESLAADMGRTLLAIVGKANTLRLKNASAAQRARRRREAANGKLGDSH
jgi:hypothetical protein